MRSVTELLPKLQAANRKWDLAVKRKGYPDPDDPNEKPFSEEDWVLFKWADAWRQVVHELEDELMKTPEWRQQYTDVGFTTTSEPTVYQGEMSPEALSQATRGLRSGFNERGGKAK